MKFVIITTIMLFLALNKIALASENQFKCNIEKTYVLEDNGKLTDEGRLVEFYSKNKNKFYVDKKTGVILGDINNTSYKIELAKNFTEGTEGMTVFMKGDGTKCLLWINTVYLDEKQRLSPKSFYYTNGMIIYTGLCE